MSVVGSGRLPTLDDKEILPYVDCIIQEVHRFNPAIPLAHHGNIVEDEYLGCRIPQKSWVMANIWYVPRKSEFSVVLTLPRAMLHDDVEYPQPDQFIPERFMPDEDLSTLPRDPRTVIYGFGRR